MASTLLSPMVDYYNDEEELDSVDDDDDRSFRGRDSEEGNVKPIGPKAPALSTCWKRDGNARLSHKICYFFLTAAFKLILQIKLQWG